MCRGIGRTAVALGLPLLVAGGCIFPIGAPPPDAREDGGALAPIDLLAPAVDATPPLVPGGLVTSPRRGQLVDEAGAAPIVVRGLVVDPMLSVAVMRLEPDGSERMIATGVSNAVAERDGGYAFSIEVPAQGRTVWPSGGLLRLRVADGRGRRLGVLERDERVCLTCGTDAPLTLVSPPSVASVDAQSRYLELKGRPTVADTEAYYVAADLPDTLAAFVARYFANATDEAVAYYYNAGDLAIGRELHCASFPTAAGPGRACYVANYGAFSGDAASAMELARQGAASGTHAGSFATVAMVYRPPVSAPNAVSFVVYSATGARLTTAQLDRPGHNDTVPANCLNCHGATSTYDVARREVRNARFLPIDPGAVRFSRGDGFAERDQAEALRRLNVHLVEAGATPAARAHVEQLYAPAGLRTPGARPQLGNDVPVGWDVSSLARAAYRDAIAPACRSCHLSMTEGGDGRSPLDFADAASTLAAGPRIIRAVCGAPDVPAAKRMPSCEVAAHAFWSGPGRAALLDFLGYRGPCAPAAQ
jgi:hypothetical protein